MTRPIHKLLLIIALTYCNFSYSQYILNGTAEKNSCNCYTLTKENQFESGSVWNSNKISLSSPFDFWFNVFLGCQDSGADGIAFILQPISTSIGTSGEGMGFEGVTPSIGIALDTYMNSNRNDPSYDHISIQSNGVINHTNDLAGPVPISDVSNNVEDCQWHRLRITWDPATHWLRAYFDGVLRVEKQLDLINSVFNGDPKVYWGFAGATGGAVNLQRFCTSLDPDFNINTPNYTACAPATVDFSDQSVSFAPITSYTWTFGNGNTSTAQVPPPQSYPTPGSYKVGLHIKGLDGCENDTTRTITVGSKPYAEANVFDTCFKNTPRLTYSNNNVAVEYNWSLDGGIATKGQPPSLNGLTAGNHQLELVVTSPFNCGPDATSTANFLVKPLPAVEIDTSQLCKVVNFEGVQLDNQTTINQWHWRFGDGQLSSMQGPTHTYADQGQYNVSLWANSTNGCSSDTATILLDIPTAIAFAGNDTTVIRNQPFELRGEGNGSFEWTPPTGLSDPYIANPTVTLSNAASFMLTVRTPEGCVAKDTVNLRAIDGPTVYVASAFTPNNDGLNDVLKPTYVGISKLERFTIYNRWGQAVYTTTTMGQGWDGSFHNQVQETGTYIWIVKAINYLNQPVLLKGTVTIIR